MPTYEYKCQNCEKTFEFFQKMSDAPKTTCPSCNGTLKRLIGTGMTPIFKGSGFYETDYKKTSNNNGNGKSKTADSSSSTSSAGTAKSDKESESIKKPA